MESKINPEHFVLTMEERLGLGLGVDAFLYEPLRELNLLGLLTSFSCQGHQKGSPCEIPYISSLVSDEIAKKILDCKDVCHDVYFEVKPFYTWLPFERENFKTLDDIKSFLREGKGNTSAYLSEKFLKTMVENRATTKIVIRLKPDKNKEGVFGLKYLPIVNQMREYLYKTKYFLEDIEKIIKKLKGE